MARGHHIWPILAWLILTACIPLSVILNTTAWALFGRAAPLIRLIGLTTYPLYLLHNVAVGAFEPSIGPWPCVIIAIAASAPFGLGVRSGYLKWNRATAPK